MYAIVLLLLFVFSFLFKADFSFDQDLGRHIKLGEIITQTGEVPKTNLFSYTYPDFPFINTHWLFEVVAYFFSISTGLQALLILKVLILLLCVFLIIKSIPKENKVLLLPLGFIFFHVLRERTDLRPEIFSFLFTTLTLYILEKFVSSQKSKAIYFLPLMQLLWINTHIYFFVGLVLQVIFLICLIYLKFRTRGDFNKIKTLGLVFLFSCILSLLNPNGLTGALYPLTVKQNYGYLIVENQTLFFLENIKFSDPNFLFVKLSWAIIVLSILYAFIKRKLNLKNLMLCGFGLVLSFMNVRSFPYLVFLSFPAVLSNFGAIKKNFATKSLIVIFAVLLLYESFLYLSGDYYKSRDENYTVNLKLIESGKKALDFLIKNDLPQPIFNNFDIGSYIIYRTYPKYKVFVDGRPESYPTQFFQGEYVPIQYDYQKFKEFDKNISLQTVIFSHTDQTPWAINFLQNIIQDPDWAVVYIDKFIIILTKSSWIEKLNLPIIDLALLSPKNYSYQNHTDYLRLGYFLAKTENINSAKVFLDKSIQTFPKSPAVQRILYGTSQSGYFW